MANNPTERTETPILTLNADHLEQLHALFWQLYIVETYVGLARAAGQEDLDKYTAVEEAIELMVKHAHKGIGSMIEGFDNLAESLGVVFSREGVKPRGDNQALPEHPLASICKRHNVDPAVMTDAIVEILREAADRPDSWEGETAQRLLSVAKSLEGWL